jgi:thiosulfate/3-mercaptopyruvate sulfurtransferase
VVTARGRDRLVAHRPPGIGISDGTLMIRGRIRSTVPFLAVVILLAATHIVAAGAEVKPLVSTDWLKAHLGEKNLLVLDIRAKEDFEAGHIPGAVDAEYPDFWRHGSGALLPLKPLIRSLAAMGVGDGTTVVIVPAGGDAAELGGATFAYWVLKYLGHDEAAILDGGWTAWRSDATDAVQRGPSTPVAAAFTAHPTPAIRATTEEVRQLRGAGAILLDARSSDQYLGKDKSGLVSRAGRIPDAINLPFSSLYDDAAHRLRPSSQLASLLPPEVAGGAADVVAYCNTGHFSSIDWFVLHELLGHANTRLYDGSMAAWTRDPHRPVESGEPRKP